jgi:hypothetical protein
LEETEIKILLVNVNRRILVGLLGIREESVDSYLWGMNPLASLAYFSTIIHFSVWGTRTFDILGDSSLLSDVMKVFSVYIVYPIAIILLSGTSFFYFTSVFIS